MIPLTKSNLSRYWPLNLLITCSQPNAKICIRIVLSNGAAWRTLWVWELLLILFPIQFLHVVAALCVLHRISMTMTCFQSAQKKPKMVYGLREKVDDDDVYAIANAMTILLTLALALAIWNDDDADADVMLVLPFCGKSSSDDTLLLWFWAWKNQAPAQTFLLLV